jgi:hypothetical protein
VERDRAGGGNWGFGGGGGDKPERFFTMCAVYQCSVENIFVQMYGNVFGVYGPF